MSNLRIKSENRKREEEEKGEIIIFPRGVSCSNKFIYNSKPFKEFFFSWNIKENVKACSNTIYTYILYTRRFRWSYRNERKRRLFERYAISDSWLFAGGLRGLKGVSEWVTSFFTSSSEKNIHEKRFCENLLLFFLSFPAHTAMCIQT